MENSYKFLEVIIQKKDDVFIAKCPSFPFCIAKAKSKKTALKNLRKLITKTISKKIDKTLTHLFEKNKFNEVIINPNKKQKENHYIYTIQKNNKLLTILLKLHTLTSNTTESLTNNQTKTTYKLDSQLHKSPKKNINIQNIKEELLITELENSILLGYPICLN